MKDEFLSGLLFRINDATKPVDAADRNLIIRALSNSAQSADTRDAARYRWLSKRVVITDGSTPGLMVITVVDDGVETGNEFLNEFTERALTSTGAKP